MGMISTRFPRAKAIRPTRFRASRDRHSSRGRGPNRGASPSLGMSFLFLGARGHPIAIQSVCQGTGQASRARAGRAACPRRIICAHGGSGPPILRPRGGLKHMLQRRLLRSIPLALGLLEDMSGGETVAKVESFRRVPHRPVSGNGSLEAANACALRPPDRESDDTTVFEDGEALLALLAAGDPPAFATDSRDRIVFWNRGMADLVGQTSQAVLGRRCYETLQGRDVF